MIREVSVVIVDLPDDPRAVDRKDRAISLTMRIVVVRKLRECSNVLQNTSDGHVTQGIDAGGDHYLASYALAPQQIIELANACHFCFIGSIHLVLLRMPSSTIEARQLQDDPSAAKPIAVGKKNPARAGLRLGASEE